MSQDKHQKASNEAVSGPEALSALMDGELSAFEYRRLIKELENHPEWLDQWEGFHLIRDGLRAEPWAEPMSAEHRPDGLSLSERIAAEVASMTPQPAQTSLNTSQSEIADVASTYNWRLITGRLAIAATVALAVFAGMQSMLPGNNGNQAIPMAASQPQQSEGSVTGPVTLPMNQNVADAGTLVDQDAQQRLNEYIRSVSIPTRTAEQSAPFNILRESPLLRPVSDRELIPSRESVLEVREVQPQTP